MSAGTGRIQFVISGRFIVLTLLGVGFIIGGRYFYEYQMRRQTPLYYVSKASTAIRPCLQCTGLDGKLKERPWKFGKTQEIPAGEQWWFAPVEEKPTPVKVDDIPMLAVHPASVKDKPWYGFDQNRVYFVVFQDLDARFSLEHPPPPPPTPTPTPTAAPVLAPQSTPTATAAQQP